MSLRVLTYNVCHECMQHGHGGSAAAYARTYCFRDATRNVCRLNVATILASGRFDVIGLQEADAGLVADVTAQMTALAHMDVPLHASPYGSVVKPDGADARSPVGVVLYNRRRVHKVGASVFEYAIGPRGGVDRGRPMLGVVLVERVTTPGVQPAWAVLFVSVHMPHGAYDLKANLARVLDKLHAEYATLGLPATLVPRVVVVGDFNHPTPKLSFQSLTGIGPAKRAFGLRAANYGARRTGWVSPTSPTLTAAVDDVLYEHRALALVPGSLATTPPELVTATSDHSFFGCELTLL